MINHLFSLIVCVSLAGSALGQEQPKEEPKVKVPKATVRDLSLRYGHLAKPDLLPQKTPEETVKSIARALGDERFDYLMAQLADPVYVDARVDKHEKTIRGGNEEGRRLLAFQRVVAEAKDHLFTDSALIRELRVFAQDAQWQVEDDRAV